MVVDAFEHYDGARVVEYVGELEFRWPVCCGQYAPVEVESDGCSHDLGAGPVERHVDPVESFPEFLQSAIDTEEADRRESGIEQTLRDEHPLCDHQTFPFG